MAGPHELGAQGKVTDKVKRWLMESTNSVTLEIMAFELLVSFAYFYLFVFLSFDC